MYFMKSYFLIIIVFNFFMNEYTAQEKFEKEYRIFSNEVPKKSLQTIKIWKLNNKVKWYAEDSNDGKTFEAKVCFKSYDYSIEFATNGSLLDVEKTIKFSELPIQTQQKLKETLAKKFVKFKIKKVQIQYTGTEMQIYKAIFQQKIIQTKAVVHYEIICKAKLKNTYALYELLFTENGDIIKELIFKSLNSLNLEF